MALVCMTNGCDPQLAKRQAGLEAKGQTDFDLPAGTVEMLYQLEI